jgi:hypothetical protein
MMNPEQINQQQNQPQIIIDKYGARKAAGKAELIKDADTQDIFFEQKIFDVNGDHVTTWKVPTNVKHLKQIKNDLKARLDTIDMEADAMADEFARRKAAIQAQLLEINTMIDDAQALQDAEPEP